MIAERRAVALEEFRLVMIAEPWLVEFRAVMIAEP